MLVLLLRDFSLAGSSGLHESAGRLRPCERIWGMMKICFRHRAAGAVQCHHLQGTLMSYAGLWLAERPKLCKSILVELGLFGPTWHPYVSGTIRLAASWLQIAIYGGCICSACLAYCAGAKQ